MKNIIHFLRKNLSAVYFIAFAFALRVSLPTYINSSFLTDKTTTEYYVGVIYALAATICLILFFAIPTILKRYGNYKVSYSLAIIDALSIFGMITTNDPGLVVMFFIISNIATALLAYTLDIFLERISDDKNTGSIRGLYLTGINIGWLIAPTIGLLFLVNNEYWRLYSVAGLISLLVFSLIHDKLKDFKDPVYTEIKPIESARAILKNKNLIGVFGVNFLIQFFYAWMLIYTPIYLTDYLHFTWKEFSFILFFILVPFVFLNFPLGKLADKKYGEKEMMALGLGIMIVSTSSLSFISSRSVIVWAILLFITRIGAATAETMAETYFFKNIASKDSGIISLYRSLVQMAYIGGPILATLVLILAPINSLFLLLGIIMMPGLFFVSFIKDTK